MNDDIMKIDNEATDYAENAPYAEAETCIKICLRKVRGRTTWQLFHILMP